MGKIGRTLSGLLIGMSSLILPEINFAESKEVFSKRADKTNITANLNEDSLEIKILPDKYDQRKTGTPKISHPDIYIIHPKRIRVKLSEIVEIGHLVPQYNWVDLESLEKVTEFFEKKADQFFSYLSGNEIGIEDWKNFLDSFKEKCEINPIINRNIKSLEKVIRENGGEYTYTEIPKDAEGMNISAIKYTIPFDLTKYEGKAQINVVARLDLPTR
ncbi:MAG: hypothetical protein AABX84_00725, partial [Nanoarchaeota archaeon]